MIDPSSESLEEARWLLGLRRGPGPYDEVSSVARALDERDAKAEVLAYCLRTTWLAYVQHGMSECPDCHRGSGPDAHADDCVLAGVLKEIG